jgi:hypothetical protein
MRTIVWTSEKKEKAIEMLTEYFKKHGIGECIFQSDSAQIDALDLMGDIADEVLIDGEGIIYTDED